MERMSVVEAFLILAANEKGKLSAFNGTASKAGLVTAGVMDLWVAQVISFDNKKIMVEASLPEQLTFLQSLYSYLSQKQRSFTKVVEDYCAGFSKKRLNQLLSDVGHSLTAKKLVSPAASKIVKKELFIPDAAEKEKLIATFKNSVLNSLAVSPAISDIILISLMKETKLLNHYFSKHERAVVKEALKELAAHPKAKQIKRMVTYVDDMMTAYSVFIVMAGS